MKHRIVLILIGCMLIGCKPVNSAGPDAQFDSADVDPSQLPDSAESAWQGAVRLTNGTVSVVIVPSLGRIMRYGYVGGPNLLWTDPTLSPSGILPHATAEAADTSAGWRNYGGDKVWPWPQDEWPLRIGRAWPPPVEVDQMPMKVKLIDPMTVRMESAPLKGYGVKLVREVQVAPSGTQVMMLTRFVSASADLPPNELSAWQVTQLHPRGKLYARLVHGGGIKPMQPKPWSTTQPVGAELIALIKPEGGVGKMGLDADALIWTSQRTMMVMLSETTPRDARRFRKGERAQVYVQPDLTVQPKFDAPNTKTPDFRDVKNAPAPSYTEMEFTSPRGDLAKGESVELRVTWELFRAERDWTDESVSVFAGSGGPPSR